MKDIKSYVIGFLTCACMFLIMGQTDNKNVMEDMKTLITQNGRYQISTIYDPEFKFVAETTLDTRTGEIIRERYKLKYYTKMKD